MVISQMNTGLSERDKFFEGGKLRVLAWNGEYPAALIFSDPDEHERFYKRSGSAEVKGRLEWVDPIGTEGPQLLRVYKDALFDQRSRSQVFYNLRKEVAAHLDSNKVWHSDTMEVTDGGVKGTVFLTSGNEIYDLFKVDINHKGGRSHYLKPVYESFHHPWGAGKEDVDGTMARAMAKVSLLERQVVNVESLWGSTGEGPKDLWEGPQDPGDAEGPRSGGDPSSSLGHDTCGGLDDGETFVAGRFESRLSVVTWNCATLFGAAPGARE